MNAPMQTVATTSQRCRDEVMCGREREGAGIVRRVWTETGRAWRQWSASGKRTRRNDGVMRVHAVGTEVDKRCDFMP